MGASLDFIVESIESLVMPVDPKRAFELLVLFFESDGVAMENCGDHDFEVTYAFERAAGLIGKVARMLPAGEVTATLERNHAIQLISKHPGVKYGPWKIRPAADLNDMIRESELRRAKDTRK
jgi:hypothetical protein